MFYLYILQSQKDKGFYIGISTDPQKRLSEHNKGKTKSTKPRIPFIIIYQKEFKKRIDPRKREIELKNNYQKRKELLTKLGFL